MKLFKNRQISIYRELAVSEQLSTDIISYIFVTYTG